MQQCARAAGTRWEAGDKTHDNTSLHPGTPCVPTHADEQWGESTANKRLLAAPFPAIITEHFVENLENCVFLPVFYEVEIKPPKPTKSSRNPLCQTSCTRVCAGFDHWQKAACL